MVNCLISAALLLLALTPCARAAGDSSPLALLSPEVLAANFEVTASPREQAAFEARTPVPVYKRGDFSHIPDYSFGYLNELTVKLIDASLSSVDVMMFSVNLKDAPDALLRARDRGVKVRLIVNESHVFSQPTPDIKRLIAAEGIELRTLRGTRAYGVNHNKIGIFDGTVATLGSYNWTFGATFSNLENILVARHPVYVQGYSAYFEWTWAKSRLVSQGPSPELPAGYYGAPPQDPAPAQSLNGTPVPAYLFSPGSDSEGRLAAIIDAAARTVDAVTFTFSSKPLAEALVRARQRGVQVRFLMDEVMAKDSFAAKLVYDGGVPVRVRRGRTDKGALHNKFAILDGRLLATGSFNWTTNASVNSFENIAFISDPGAVKAYQDKYDWFYSSSTAPTGDFFQPEPYFPEPPAPAAD
ncbi:MAG: phospholipase D-like domain-containing protein [Elusimicrobiales bacterium]|nr:phospholipase D-like domain-containing protein [Elusimicrobiales bacterium]